MFSWVITAVLLVSPPAPVPAAEVEPLPQEQVMALPSALRTRLHDEVLVERMSQDERLQRLADFMFQPQPQGLGLLYEEDATYTVERTYETRRGNCVAFTLLFLALAREAGLDAWPQETVEVQAWHLRNNTLYRTNHVDAGVRAGGRTYRVDGSPVAVVARYPPERIEQRRLLAHYYNNHAIAAMDNGQLPLALRYMAIAIDLDPNYAITWSNAGVLSLRSGDAVAAEHAYATALTLDPQNIAALFNMVGLLQRTGDAKREAGFRRRLERVQQEDPFYHFVMAMDDERSGDYANAIEHFRRAIRLYPREYRFHAALAAAYRQVGDVRRADKALARARALGGKAVRDADLTAPGDPQQPLVPPGG